MQEKFNKLIESRIREGIKIGRTLLGETEEISNIAGLLIEAYRQGKKAIFLGNGGSAADAQHIAAEFMGKFYLDRKPLPAEALNVNTSLLTAIGNDYGFDQIFARQIDALGNSGDVAIGISTSGNSPNVLEAIRVAKRKGMATVGLTGDNGGQLRAETEYCICVPSKQTPRIQEAHILIGHILCEIVEKALFGKE
jgi:D-sedoheptulose 7-phosphate isomerase